MTYINMETSRSLYISQISKVTEKLQHLEHQHHKLQRRQDTIDNLALDTLFKMEILLAKMKTVQTLATTMSSTTTLHHEGSAEHITTLNALPKAHKIAACLVYLSRKWSNRGI